MSEWVRKPLVWCGEADPWVANEKARQDDPEITAIKNLLEICLKIFGNEKIPLSKIVEYSELKNEKNELLNADLADIISELAHDPKEKIKGLTYKFRKYKGRPFNGLKLEASEESHGRAKVKLWGIAGDAKNITRTSISNELRDLL